ncbi:class I SAM-dependent methyltransferase [Dyella solisilvae]|uniref:class I SAM-dependent methyltransferase n=1 Tax=Dyella solisilvae TaxID=1920168 RepID=UPI0011C07F15|nr:class I SAM-dependent methyltransferase [Dyella solisilvae]
MIHWLEGREQFQAFADQCARLRVASEEWLSTIDSVNGYCVCCERVTTMQIRSGAMLGHLPNLREGLLCSDCGLSNRCRLIYKAVVEEMHGDNAGAKSILLLERVTPLYARLANHFPDLIGSEYLGPGHQGGGEYPCGPETSVRHESLVSLSFANNSLRLLVHNDILEHIPDYRQAISESHRALIVGGATIFTCPFFVEREETLIRARMNEDGTLRHFETPEFHGDPLNSSEGILAFYHHGWDLLDDLRAAGFRDVKLGVTYDVFAGFVSNNFPGGGYGLMLPILIRARK